MNHIWKKALAVLLTAILVVGVSPATGLVGLLAAAEPVGGTCGAEGGNLTWSLDGGALTISGTGDMAEYDDEDNLPPWAEYNEEITSATIGSGVTSISDYAFYYYPALTSIVIGEDVTYIGELAFCLSPVESVFIPRAVEEIGENAFACLTMSEDDEITPTIQSITVDPDNADFSAQDGVLYDKDGETLIQYPIGNPQTSFTIPDGVKTIGSGSFVLSLFLTSVTFPDTVTEIESAAFEQCFTLESVTFGSGLDIIREDAFLECVSLTSVTIPDSVTMIDDSAFLKCENLQTLTLGSGLENIGKSAFADCSSLTGVTIPGSVTQLGSRAFDGCGSMQTLTIENGIEIISNSAFSSCGITAVAIPDSVTQIGSNAFSNCVNLADVTFGAGLETIDANAFYGCAFESVHIPSGVTTIGNDAFAGCDNLVYICSDAADGAAKAYANAAGIEFRYCGSGEQPGNTVSGSCGAEGSSVTWTLDLDTGAMTISGTGAMADYDYDNAAASTAAPWAAYIDSIVSVTVENGVTNVGNYAFYSCENLTDVTIGSDVTTIGIDAFANCVSLTNVSFGNSVAVIGSDAFGACYALSEVTLPDSLTTIGEGAFEMCMSLESITLSEGLTTIGEGAFCFTALTSVSIPSTVQEIGDLAFVGVTTDENNNPVPMLQQIDVDPDNAFFCSDNGVLYSKEKATLIQYPCGASGDLFEIPDSVTEIGSGAFVFSMNLKEVIIPGNVKSIGEDAFEYCVLLQEVVIPQGVTEIADSTFADCRSLTSVTIPDGVKSIGEYAFDGCALTEAVIPNSVQTIGKRAFVRCASLTNVTFGSGLEVIGESAFADTGLTSVILPDNLTEIGSNAFASCGKLESVHIPASVKTIGDNVFSSCPNLVFICSDSTDSYAKTYAEANGIEFRLCAGHTSSADTIQGECGAEGDNVLWALNLGSGEMVLSGTGAMADYASTNDVPWAEYRASIQSVLVQSGVTTIGDYAFCGCVPLTSVTIGEDVTAIGKSAFARTALTQVALPADVQTIGEDAFDCYTTFDGTVPTLQAFAVDPASETFCAVDGVLYNKARTTLIRYPSGSLRAAFVIPDTVTTIEDFAFKNASNLTSVHVPASVTQIGAGAFAVCSSLEYICCDSADSYVKTFAAEYCLPFRLCVGHNGVSRVAGDASGDGIVNLKDAVLMRRYLAGGWDDVTILAANADVDADNTVSLQDVTLVCRYLAGGWNVELI